MRSIGEWSWNHGSSRVAGMVQNQDGIVHLKAEHVEELVISAIQVTSHDFHNCCCFTLRLFALNFLLFHTFSTARCKFDKECSKGMHVISRAFRGVLRRWS